MKALKLTLTGVPVLYDDSTGTLTVVGGVQVMGFAGFVGLVLIIAIFIFVLADIYRHFDD